MGLISLQVFNDDMDPEIADFLQNTDVDVDGNKLTISVALDPEVGRRSDRSKAM